MMPYKNYLYQKHPVHSSHNISKIGDEKYRWILFMRDKKAPLHYFFQHILGNFPSTAQICLLSQYQISDASSSNERQLSQQLGRK